MRFPRTAMLLLISDHGLVDMLSGNPYDRVEFRRKPQGETLMSEGIKPGHPDQCHCAPPRFIHCDSYPSRNFVSPLKINGPDFPFLASHVWRYGTWSSAFTRHTQRS
jgi:hypothetical protein